LDDLKAWLGRLYKEGDPDLRICIVQATLEHLFEKKQIRKFFDDWKNDEVLAVAHEEASEWYKGGGTSPLGKAR
jgi:DNA-binding transcriptional MerR regulator